MKKTLTSLSLASILSIYLLHPIAYADLDKGVVAYNKKDYPTAFKEFTESANQGDALAQLKLGVMYANGEGVPKNAKEAVKWYQLAADQGYDLAQSFLSVMYANGEGVEKNLVLAYALVNLAAAQLDNAGVKKSRDLIERQLTPEQLEEAQAISSAWQVGTPFPTQTKH